MSWARLDDGYDGNPKMLRLGLTATGLHARAIAYCAQHETDGKLPAAWVNAQLAELKPAEQRRLLEALLEANALERNGSGYVIHDFLEYNPSRAELAARRQEEHERKAAAGRKGAEARWGNRRTAKDG